MHCLCAFQTPESACRLGQSFPRGCSPRPPPVKLLTIGLPPWARDDPYAICRSRWVLIASQAAGDQSPNPIYHRLPQTATGIHSQHDQDIIRNAKAFLVSWCTTCENERAGMRKEEAAKASKLQPRSDSCGRKGFRREEPEWAMDVGDCMGHLDWAAECPVPA